MTSERMQCKVKDTTWFRRWYKILINKNYYRIMKVIDKETLDIKIIDMQADIATMKDLKDSVESHIELDTISNIKVFDVSYEVGWYTFYFRCTKNYHTDMWQENTIELLQEDSDYCDIELEEYMKDKITELYL